MAVTFCYQPNLFSAISLFLFNSSFLYFLVHSACFVHLLSLPVITFLFFYSSPISFYHFQHTCLPPSAFGPLALSGLTLCHSGGWFVS